DFRAEPHADDHRSRREHFWHARAAFRPLVADDDDVAFLHLAVRDAREGYILGVEADGRSPVVAADGRIHRADLDDRAVWRQVPEQDGKAAFFAVRVVQRPDDHGIFDLAAFHVFPDRFAGDRDAVA